MQPESEESYSGDAARLHYDSPASSYKKGSAPRNHLVVSPSTSYLSPKSKAFLSPSENVGGITPPTSKASSSPGGDDYSPISNYSRESSCSGIIDHTALLLGLHEELEDEKRLIFETYRLEESHTKWSDSTEGGNVTWGVVNNLLRMQPARQDFPKTRLTVGVKTC